TYLVLSSFLPHQAESKITDAVMVTSSCFLFSMVVVVLIQFIRTSETNITTDQSVLLAFRAHIINLDPQRILATNWSSATPVCNWAGVTCSRRHNRVAALNLSYMGLVGTIPPDIGNISFLASLDIRNNSFTGNLPKEMAHLRRLKELNLHYNEFSGGLPTRRHNRVAALNLSYMGLVGTIPPDIGNILFLASLYIRNNSFSGNQPKEMTHLRRLKEMNLHYNEFSAGLPTTHIINLDPQHILATNWSSATPVCNWAGVTCSHRHIRVAALNLSYIWA
ncbi:hypothetical protein RJ640_014015, partial [Escallonia rubra]